MAIRFILNDENNNFIQNHNLELLNRSIKLTYLNWSREIRLRPYSMHFY